MLPHHESKSIEKKDPNLTTKTSNFFDKDIRKQKTKSQTSKDFFLLQTRLPTKHSEKDVAISPNTKYLSMKKSEPKIAPYIVKKKSPQPNSTRTEFLFTQNFPKNIQSKPRINSPHKSFRMTKNRHTINESKNRHNLKLITDIDHTINTIQKNLDFERKKLKNLMIHQQTESENNQNTIKNQTVYDNTDENREE